MMSRYTDLAKRVSAIEFAINNAQRDLAIVTGNLAALIGSTAQFKNLPEQIADLDRRTVELEDNMNTVLDAIIDGRVVFADDEPVAEFPAEPETTTNDTQQELTLEDDPDQNQEPKQNLEPKKRMVTTKYDPTCVWLNSVQLRDKYRGREMDLFGRVRISTVDINKIIASTGLAAPFHCGKGLRATPLGMKTGLLNNGGKSGHLAYKNCDEMDNLLSMMFCNPLKTKAYINNLSAKLVQESAAQ